MTDTDGLHRSHYRGGADSVHLREAEEVEGDDDMMEIRLPIASTGEVRNEGDDALTMSDLRGMAQQVDSLQTGVFPEHGMSSAVDSGQYSQFEKLGYWSDAGIEREAADDESDLLMATARMPDPETLPAATGDYREALAILKEQAKRGIPIDASIGWREDDAYPGGNDLMEASIVGIGADPRTQTEGGTDALARAAVDAGADPEQFVARVRELVMRDDGTVRRAVGDDDWSAELRMFRVVAPEDREDEFNDPVLGVGVSFPESGVYVDWHTSAFPDELENPHVSEYGSIADLEKATGNEIVDLSPPAGARRSADTERATYEAKGEEIPYDRHASDTDSDTDGSHDMSDSDDPGDDAGTTETDEQSADDGDNETRQPDTCPECGADVPDGANYCPECGEQLGDGDREGDEMDDEEEDEEEDEDDMDEQSAADPDAERSAATDDGDDDGDDLRERVAELEDALAEVRNGGITADDVDVADDADSDERDADDETDAEADADSTDAETRDTPTPADGLGDYT